MALFKRRAAGCSGSCPSGCWLERDGAGGCTCVCSDARVRGLRLGSAGGSTASKVAIGAAVLLAAAGAGKLIAHLSR